jgi:hypothetical protein
MLTALHQQQQPLTAAGGITLPHDEKTFKSPHLGIPRLLAVGGSFSYAATRRRQLIGKLGLHHPQQHAD